MENDDMENMNDIGDVEDIDGVDNVDNTIEVDGAENTDVIETNAHDDMDDMIRDVEKELFNTPDPQDKFEKYQSKQKSYARKNIIAIFIAIWCVIIAAGVIFSVVYLKNRPVSPDIAEAYSTPDALVSPDDSDAPGNTSASTATAAASGTNTRVPAINLKWDFSPVTESGVLHTVAKTEISVVYKGKNYL